MSDKTKQYQMTPEEKEAQRISFAYGNTKIENDDITREMVVEQSEKLREENKPEQVKLTRDEKLRAEGAMNALDVAGERIARLEADQKYYMGLAEKHAIELAERGDRLEAENAELRKLCNLSQQGVDAVMNSIENTRREKQRAETAEANAEQYRQNWKLLQDLTGEQCLLDAVEFIKNLNATLAERDKEIEELHAESEDANQRWLKEGEYLHKKLATAREALQMAAPYVNGKSATSTKILAMVKAALDSTEER